MSRLEEIKDQIASEKGKSSFEYLINQLIAESEYDSVKELSDEVTKRYACECCIATQAKILENVDIEGHDWHLDNESITNPDNIVLL